MRSALILACILCTQLFAAIVELRPVRPASLPGTRPMKVEGTGEVLHLGSPAIIDDHDIARAGVATAEGQPVLTLALHPAAGLRLREFSKGNVGKRFALVIEGKIFQAPVLKDPILGDSFIVGGMTEARAKELADRINGLKARR